MKKTVLNTLTIAILFFASTAYAQVGVGVPAENMHPSAELEVKSTTKGFLPPRMTNAERDAIATPATGLLIYQTDAVANNPTGLYFYDGTAWRNGTAVQGIKGDKGDTGAQGLQGQVGAQGQKGDTGLKGDRGDTGAQGLQGANGLPGAAGTKGDKGDKGETGAQGLQGLPGAAGTKGDKGDRGDRGETGAQGVQGDKGETGAIGPKGETGPAGSGSAHYIGEDYGGGIVFYVYDGGQHGLIAAPADQSTNIKWSYTFLFSTFKKAVRDGVGAGKFNTERINTENLEDYAADLCANYRGGNYGDWYLPSKYELNLLYLQKTVVGGFSPRNYWSSTEYDNVSAWVQFFGYGGAFFTDKNSPDVSARAIRAF
jgi:hypothetical protein